MIWKYLFALLAFFRSPNPGPSEYPPEVLEPWGTVSYSSSGPKPWEPQTLSEKNAAQKALHQNYYGGDIKVRPRSLVGNSVSDKTLLWKNKKVPYVISGSINPMHRPLILRAMDQYNKLTPLKFVQRTNEKDYVKIENKTNDGCWSELGRIGGVQYMNLGDGCHYVGTITHELGHAIGFYHEHQRHDRDTYVTINPQNIARGYEDQFERTRPSDEIIYNNFDHNSIMIYGNYAFSKKMWSLKTMEAKNGRELTEPYNKPGLDNSDIDRINCMYGKKCKEIKP